MNIVNTTCISSEDMISKLQELKGETKLKFFKIISKYSDEMNIRNFKIEQITFSKNAQGISKLYHEVLLLMKFLQIKPQVENMKNYYFVLYYTTIENRNDKEIVNNKNEDNESDSIIFNDINNPIHCIGIKPPETIFK